MEIKLGVVTALIGVPFFVAMIFSRAADAGRIAIMNGQAASKLCLRLGHSPCGLGTSSQWGQGKRVTLRAGELVALVGPNGAGKTTLIRALAGLVSAEGEIMLGDRRLVDIDKASGHARVAYLPQGHIFNWPMPVAALVALGRHPLRRPILHAVAAGPPRDQPGEARDRDRAVAHRLITTLSGGERARVALARALARGSPRAAGRRAYRRA